jgi:2-(1,2-epoxy-1,2-dihydrophenyl)acetyl-CoA isomerase
VYRRWAGPCRCVRTGRILTADSAPQQPVSPSVLVAENDGIATITLNRPERGNAITYELVERLHEIVAGLAQRSDVRAVVLTGSGRQFCVGGDLGADAFATDRRSRPFDADVSAQIQRGRLASALRSLPQLTIAAINGACAGAGLALALACDLRVAVSTAVFRTAYVDAGVSGDYGITWLLPALLGEARARELMLTSEKLGAARAYEFGLVTRVVDAAELSDAVTELARHAARRPPLAIAAIKANLAQWSRLTLEEHIAVEADRQVRTARSNDAVEAASAFLAKRPAQYTGH